MNRKWICSLIVLAGVTSCIEIPTPLLPFETEFSLVNLSQRWYAAIGLRPAASTQGQEEEFTRSDLIPPGGIFRERFFTLFPETGGCPDRLDITVHLYKRLNEDIPIGLDPGEAVDPTPVASDELLDVVACEAVVVSTFTIVLRDSDEGQGVLKFVQETGAAELRAFEGTNLPELEVVPELLEAALLEGQVLLPDGTPLGSIGVLLRTRFRVTDDDRELCPDEPVGFCYSEPIAFDLTDDEGRFSFDRPPGAYLVEVFADDFEFRPVFVAVESPIDNILFFAEAQ